MRRTSALLFALLLMVATIATAVELPAPAPTPAPLSVGELQMLLQEEAPLSPITGEALVLESLGVPDPTFACTPTNWCASCSHGLKYCERRCPSGSTWCGVCGAC